VKPNSDRFPSGLKRCPYPIYPMITLWTRRHSCDTVSARDIPPACWDCRWARLQTQASCHSGASRLDCRAGTAAATCAFGERNLRADSAPRQPCRPAQIPPQKRVEQGSRTHRRLRQGALVLCRAPATARRSPFVSVYEQPFLLPPVTPFALDLEFGSSDRLHELPNRWIIIYITVG